MAAKNRKCLSCGEKFSYCPDCSRTDKLAPSWKAEFCSEPCMTLWTTLTKYNMEFLTKDEAKEIVSNLDIKSIDAYANCVQRDYAKVMEEGKKSRKFIKKIEPMVQEVEQPEVATVHEVVTTENE